MDSAQTGTVIGTMPGAAIMTTPYYNQFMTDTKFDERSG